MDTIHFKLNRKHFDYNRVLDIFEYSLNPQSTLKYKRGYRGKSIYSTYKNWRFTLTENNLIGKGSLAKLYNGNNYVNISFEDCQLALNQLQKILEVNLQNAIITRLDIGYNLIISKPVRNYLNLYLCPDSFKEFEVRNETHEFRGKNNSLIFYDKVKEVGKTKLPLSYRKVNLLRYELKLKSMAALRSTLYTNCLKFSDLYDPNVFENLLAAWFNNFIRLTRISSMPHLELDYSSVTDLKNTLIASAINSYGGIDSMYKMINANCVNAKVKYDIKKSFKKLDFKQQVHSGLAKELHNQIIRTYCFQQPDRLGYCNYTDMEILV